MANLYAAAVNTVFTLVVQDVYDLNSVDSGLNPGSSPNSGAANAWFYARGLSSYFGEVSEGSRSVNIAYYAGGATAQATDTLTFSTNPSNNDTITIGGVLITLVTGTPSGSQVKIGSTLALTIAAIIAFINAGGSSNNIASLCYATNPTASVIKLTSCYPGIIGNLITLAKVSTAITLGGATFSGGAITKVATPPLSIGI